MDDEDRGLAGKVGNFLSNLNLVSFGSGMRTALVIRRWKTFVDRLAWGAGGFFAAFLLIFVVGGVLKNMFMR